MTRVFVVTGANKGIGKSVVETLIQKLEGGIVYLTARNPALGQATLTELTSSHPSAKARVLFHQLETTDDSSCQAFAAHIRDTHGGLDVLINNAGIFPRGTPPKEQAEQTIGVNYFGTRRVTEALLDLIRKDGRIINVCSTLGSMKTNYSKERVEAMKNVKTVEEIDKFVAEYIASTDPDKRDKQGFSSGDWTAYRVSKTAEIAYSVLLAKQLKSKGIDVHACCPGYCSTDMTSHNGQKTAEQGADTAVFLALENNLEPGQFWYERKATPWY